MLKRIALFSAVLNELLGVNNGLDSNMDAATPLSSSPLFNQLSEFLPPL